jgi:signal peptidase II
MDALMKKIIAVMLGVVLLDQLAKGALLYLITGSVPAFGSAWRLVPYPYLMARVGDFFNIVFTWNPGTSFSLFRALGEAAPIVLIALTGFIIGALGYYLFARVREDSEKWALSLIVGGALGNLIDRVRFGAVIDFLDFHVYGWHWPAFNVADVCICIGVAVYVINWLFKGRGTRKVSAR